jgi:hypothetical protein
VIPKKKKFTLALWQICLSLILLFIAGCSKADSREGQQPTQARPLDGSPGPRLPTGNGSVAMLDGARNTPPTEGSGVTSSAAASKPRADVTRASHVNGTKPPYEEPIETPRPVRSVTPTSSRVEPSAKLAEDGRESEIHFARFLIQAGLSPMAVESLRQIIKESPGTRAAREAQQILDSIAKTK